jgi:hypothetical protein
VPDHTLPSSQTAVDSLRYFVQWTVDQLDAECAEGEIHVLLREKIGNKMIGDYEAARTSNRQQFVDALKNLFDHNRRLAGAVRKKMGGTVASGQGSDKDLAEWTVDALDGERAKGKLHVLLADGIGASVIADYESDRTGQRKALEKNLALMFSEDPARAMKICKAMDWVIPFGVVLTKEREQIADLRRGREVAPQGADYIGLALSGGGIRSATFNLGVLQALASHKLLRSIDYLSTVSGGGYIGSWLLAWLKRSSFKEVEDWLNPNWTAHPDENKPAPQIEFLRDYSNYLTPHVGFLTADTWTAVATIARNLFLNLAILVSVTVGVLLMPYLLTCIASRQWAGGGWTLVFSQLFLVAAFLVFACHFYRVMAPPRLEGEGRSITHRRKLVSLLKWLSNTQGGILVPLCSLWFLGVRISLCLRLTYTN